MPSSTFSLDGFFDNLEDADDSFSPDGTELGAGLSTAKADGVKFSKDEGWYVPEGKENGNPAALKLKYMASTGMFTGTFKVFGVTDSGRQKKWTANVFGAFTKGADGTMTGYGTATIKKIGSIPVTIVGEVDD